MRLREHSSSPTRGPDLVIAVWAFAALTVAACGGSATTQATTTPNKHAVVPQPPPPLPTDPWAIVPDHASSLLVLDAAVLQASAHAELLGTWARGSGCMSAEQEALLFQKTTRVLGATYAGEASALESLLVLQGEYVATDLRHALELRAALTQSAATPATEQTQGRLHVISSAQGKGVRVGSGLLVVGDAAAVDAAIRLVDGAPEPRLKDGALLADSGVGSQLAAATIVVLGAPSDAIAQRARRSVRALGLPQDLLEGALALTVQLRDDGARVDARITKPSPTLAEQHAQAARGRLGQIALLARLAGLPPVLDRTEIRSEGATLVISALASHADIVAISARLHEDVRDASSCAR